MSSSMALLANSVENNKNTGMGRRIRCISCSESNHPTNYEDPSLLLNVRTRHLRTQSISEQIQTEYQTGTVTYFCRSRGHGFIRPELNPDSSISDNQIQNNNSKSSTEDLFVHISDIDSDFVPRKGDKVSYRMCPYPPKFEKFQAVNVRIISMSPKPHNRWDTPDVKEDDDAYEDDLKRGMPDV